MSFVIFKFYIDEMIFTTNATVVKLYNKNFKIVTKLEDGV